MLKIGVDVDLVLAQSDWAWWSWLHKVSFGNKYLPDQGDLMHYNLSEYFEMGDKDPMDFWRQEGLYDWIEPVQGSVRALKKLKEELDCEIITISHCKGNHYKSKWQFLKRYYGSCVDAYMVTKEKNHVNVDMLIDDRVSYLNMMPSNVECIRLETFYTQDAEPTREILVKQNWDEIVKYILEWHK